MLSAAAAISVNINQDFCKSVDDVEGKKERQWTVIAMTIVLIRQAVEQVIN